MTRSLFALAVVLTALPGVAHAQANVPAFDLDRLSLNAGARETLTADTGDALPQGALRLTVAGQYQHAPLLLTLNDRVLGAYVAGRASVHVVGAYGVLPWLEVGAHVPVVVAQGGDDFTSRGYAPVASTALAAPALQGRASLLAEERGQPVDLTGALVVRLPLGSAEALAREPGAGFAVTPRLGVGRKVGFVRVGGEVGATLREATTLTLNPIEAADEVGSQLDMALAVSTTSGALRGELTVRGVVPFTAAPPSLEVLAGARLALLGGQIELLALAGPGLGKTPGTPAFRAVLGLAWMPTAPTAPPPPSQSAPPSGLQIEELGKKPADGE
jgi:hypothetical protein